MKRVWAEHKKSGKAGIAILQIRISQISFHLFSHKHSGRGTFARYELRHQPRTLSSNANPIFFSILQRGACVAWSYWPTQVKSRITCKILLTMVE